MSGDCWHGQKEDLPVRLSRGFTPESCKGNKEIQCIFSHSTNIHDKHLISFSWSGFKWRYGFLTIEHLEILDDRSKREAANSIWKWLGGVVRWGMFHGCYSKREDISEDISGLKASPAAQFHQTNSLIWCCSSQKIPLQTNENDCGVFVLEVPELFFHFNCYCVWFVSSLQILHHLSVLLSLSIPDVLPWHNLSSSHRKTYQRFVRGSTKSSVIVSSTSRVEQGCSYMYSIADNMCCCCWLGCEIILLHLSV